MLLALSLLTSAASASAECAWVLWSGKAARWAYAKKADCEGDHRWKLVNFLLAERMGLIPNRRGDGITETQITELAELNELLRGALSGEDIAGARITELLKRAEVECVPDTPVTETLSECNWLLWTDAPMLRPNKTSFATEQECEMARADANQVMAKVGESAFVCGESDTFTPQQQHVAAWRLIRTEVTRVTPSRIGTFKTYQQCVQQQLDATRELRGPAYCLPDTVDPRGVKGK